MATIDKVDIGALQTLGASNPRMGQSAASLPAYPLAAPANHEDTTAAKLPVVPMVLGWSRSAVSRARSTRSAASRATRT
jgi:hypothetical protein